MTKEAFEFLSEQAVEAQPRYFQPPGEPSEIYYLLDKDGEFRRHTADPLARNYSASRIEDFIELAKDQATSNGLVMVGVSAVVCLLDEATRRERVSFKLTKTKAFLTLEKCEAHRRPMAQSGFVSMLRVDLNGTVGPEVVGTFRQIKFEKNQSHESEVTNTNRGISSKITMKLAAGGRDIPDSLSVKVALFEEFPDLLFGIDCAIETNIEEASFVLIPLAGELSTATRSTQHEIAQRIRDGLKESSISVYCGEVNR